MDIILRRPNVVSDFDTTQSHAIKDEGGLSVRVGVSGMFCHLESSTDTTGHNDCWWFCSALSSGFSDGYFGLNIEQIYPVLICLLDVK